MVISHLGPIGSGGGKTPALTVVAIVGVVAGLFLKPGPVLLHMPTGVDWGREKWGLVERLLH